MNDKTRTIIVIIAAIIFGLLQSGIILLFPQGITDYGYVALYLFRCVILWSAFSMVYTIINDLLMLFAKVRMQKSIYISYCVASGIGTLFLSIIRPIEVIGIFIIFVNVIINSIIMYRKGKYLTTYPFYEELKIENQHSKRKEKLKNQELKWSIIGILLGALPSLILIITYIINNKSLISKANELTLVVSIAINLLSLIIFPILVEKITGNIYSKHLQKKNCTDKYWLLKNICLKSYLIFVAISYVIILMLMFHIDYVYAIALSITAYFISRKRLPMDRDSLPDWAYGSDKYPNINTKQNKNYDPSLSFAYFKDEKGNYSGSATSYDFGGVGFTDFKDAKGDNVATGTSVDIGGIKHTTIKKKK